MSKVLNSASDTHESSPAQKSATFLLLGDIADTSWRMFVPTIGLGTGGFFIDKVAHTQPIFVILGIAIGACLAGLLIRQQLRKVKQS